MSTTAPNVSETPQSARDLNEFSISERMWLGVMVAVAALLWVFVGGAWIAARVTGNDLGINGIAGIEALLELPGHLSDPAEAWSAPADTRLPGPVLYWLCTTLALGPVVAVAWLWHRYRRRRRLGLEQRVRLGVDAEARFATVKDLAPMLVDGPVPGRLILGRVHGRLVATENPAVRPAAVASATHRTVRANKERPVYRPARGAVKVVGPSQSGKSALLIPAIHEWEGPAIVSSVKTDLIDETWGYRATLGECRVYDPCRVTGLMPASWSPLRGAATWTGAQQAAHAIRSCAPVSTGQNANFFDGQMEQCLAGYLWVAAHYGYGMRDVVRWIATQDAPGEEGPGEVSSLLNNALVSDDPDVAEDASFAAETLQGLWTMQDRTRADVFATARGAVWPWSNRDVVGSSKGCDLTLEWLTQPGQFNTTYVAAPLADTDRLKPAIGGAISDLLNQIYVHCTRTGKPLDPPLLLVLDEIGNTPLRDLPRHVSVLSGLGVQVVTVWQSIAQIHKEYGEAAATVIGNHRTKVLFSGISDGVTGALTAKLLGDEQVLSRQMSSELGELDGGRRSLSESLVTTSIVPAHVLREQTPGSALLIHGNIPPAHLQVRSQFSDAVLLERASMPVPRHHEPPRRPQPPRGPRPTPEWARRIVDAAAATGGADRPDAPAAPHAREGADDAAPDTASEATASNEASANETTSSAPAPKDSQRLRIITGG